MVTPASTLGNAILSNLINFGRFLIAQIAELLLSIMGTPYSAVASNIILIIVAIVIIVLGVSAGWIAKNRDKIYGLFTPESSVPKASPATIEATAPMLVQSNTPLNGLTQVQAEERRTRGQVNTVADGASRSIADILKANIFTRFNALLGGLFVLILLLSGKQDALFGLIIVSNTAIGIIQEIRAKRTLDRLTVLVAPRARVVREGALLEIPVDEIVLDEIIDLRPGDQIPVDGVVQAGDNLEVNESLLTGEVDPIIKIVHDQVLSGSFVVAGNARIQAVRVGEEAYARRLTRAARRFTLSNSELRLGINLILRYVGWVIIPTAALLLITQLLYSDAGWRDAVISSIGGLVGMVPQGLVLLTSLVMATAVVRLGKKQALVQELAAVELLARVDVLLLDKTGTLTTGAMKLDEIIMANEVTGAKPLPGIDHRAILGAFAHADANPNPSLAALGAVYPLPTGSDWEVASKVIFSSARKWSALNFKKNGSWVLGAPEIVLKENTEAQPLLKKVNALAKNGKRILVLAYSAEAVKPAQAAASLPSSIRPAALVVLAEQIRADVAETIRYFKEQRVAVKVISGDHPETIKAVATIAGIPNGLTPYDGRNLPADLDRLGEIIEQHNLFGRVTPDQKRSMVNALQKRQHVVAMIGDGINDVLAIKEANFGIALGSGTPASRAVAQLILLGDNFSALPGVIAEGRRVIANVERTANLFITKTVYVFAMAIAVGIAQVPFPFLPRHLMLIDFFTIGTPALFLSFAKNTTRVRSGFISRVLRFAFPAGAIVAAATLMVYAVTRQIEPADVDLARTAATFVIIGCGLLILTSIIRAHAIWQRLLLIAWLALLASVIAAPLSRTFFTLEIPTLMVWLAIVIIVTICAAGFRVTEPKNYAP